MIWTIARKEFLEKILDFRVVASMVIAIVFTLVVAYVVGENYKATKASYDQEVTAAENDYREIRVYSEFGRRLVFPPSPLAVFSTGSGLPAPLALEVSPTKVPKFEPRLAASGVFLRIFDSLDLLTVFRVLFALLVTLLTYDSFAGEKETGTLRLLLSTSVSRLQLFLGKCLGVFLIVVAVSTMTYALAMLCVRWIAGIGLASSDYVRAFIALCSTLLYLLLFTMMGLCNSILFRHSSTSLVVSLLVWFIIAIVQPNINSFLATEFSVIPRFRDIEPALQAREDELDKKVDRLTKDAVPSDKPNAIYGALTRLTDAEFGVLEYAIKRAQLEKEYIDAAEYSWRQYQEIYLLPLRRQATLNHALDLVAPAAMFRRCTSVLSRTDVDNYESFFERAREYRHQCIDYLDRKGVYSNNAHLFFSRLAKEEINYEATAQRMERYKKDRSFIPWIDQQPPLDLRDAPSYTLTEANLVGDASRIALELGLMLLYCVLLGTTGIIVLNKYDVR